MGFQLIRRAAFVAGIGAASILPAAVAAQIVVRGVLYDDASGAPVRGTVMLVNPGTDAAVVYAATDSLGGFSLQTTGGLYQIGAVRPGYKSVLSAPVPFQNGERLTIRLPIAEAGDPQHNIGVVEHIRPDGKSVKAAEGQRAVKSSEYETHRKVGNGLHYDRERLEKASVATLGQFLQTVPGLTVRDPSSTRSMNMTRNAALTSANGLGAMGMSCRMGWFMDGRRIDLPGRTDPLTDGLGSISLENVEAVEIFRGLSEMPPEYAAPDLRCGAIAIWTRK